MAVVGVEIGTVGGTIVVWDLLMQHWKNGEPRMKNGSTQPTCASDLQPVQITDRCCRETTKPHPGQRAWRLFMRLFVRPHLCPWLFRASVWSFSVFTGWCKR